MFKNTMKKMEVNNIYRLTMILVISILFCQCSRKYNDVNVPTYDNGIKENFISILNINCFPAKEIPLPYLSFTISNKTKCYNSFSNENYYLIYKGKRMKLDHDHDDGHKMYLAGNLEVLYSGMISKKKNKVGEEIYLYMKKILRTFLSIFQENHI